MSLPLPATLKPSTIGAWVRASDQAIDAVVSRVRCPVLDAVFYPLSSAADHSLLWLALSGIREAAGRSRPGTTMRLARALLVESAVTNGVLKTAFGRIRPTLDDGMTDRLPFGLHRPVTSAFPSGHATAGFTAAVFLSRSDPGPPWYLLASVVGFSRVYVRMHHASDVVAGAALGIAFGAVARR